MTSAFAAAAPAGAHAAPRGAEAARTPGADASAATVADRAVRAYWTPQRMRQATTRNALAGAQGPQDASPKPLPISDGKPWPGDAKAVQTVGRLFMVLPKGQHASCTGAVVEAGNRSLIATAAHCVHLKSVGGYMAKLLFVPGYHKGAKPHGTFVARSLAAAPAWTVEENHSADFAFVTLGPNEKGQRVQDAVGARRVTFTMEWGNRTALGYPYAKPFDGESLNYCYSSSFPILDPKLSGGEELNPCRMTNGASGGPVYAHLNPDTGDGVQVGVVSARPAKEGSGQVAWVAMFNDTARKLYEGQQHTAVLGCEDQQREKKEQPDKDRPVEQHR